MCQKEEGISFVWPPKMIMLKDWLASLRSHTYPKPTTMPLVWNMVIDGVHEIMIDNSTRRWRGNLPKEKEGILLSKKEEEILYRWEQ